MRNGRILKKHEVQRQTAGRLPIIGKIKIGEKRISQNGKEYPASLDYFRATGPYESLFHDAYQDRPKTLQVLFQDDDPMKVCREEIDGRGEKDGKRYGYSYDGVTYHLWDEREQDYVPCSPSEEELSLFATRYHIRWNHTLHLFFVLPEIKGVIGQWQFSTKGDKSSMPQIVEAFDTMQEGIGSIVNVPFDLQVEKVKGQKPTVGKDGKPESRSFPVVTLIPNISTRNMEVLRGYLETHADFRQLGVIMSDERIQALASGIEQKALGAAQDTTALIAAGDAICATLNAMTADPVIVKALEWWEANKATLSADDLGKTITRMTERLEKVRQQPAPVDDVVHGFDGKIEPAILPDAAPVEPEALTMSEDEINAGWQTVSQRFNALSPQGKAYAEAKAAKKYNVMLDLIAEAEQ